MSNQIVGQIYQQVIEKVIQASQNDFEEFGVDQTTLAEMKEVRGNISLAQSPQSFIAWLRQPAPLFSPSHVLFNIRRKIFRIYLELFVSVRLRMAAWAGSGGKAGKSGAGELPAWQTRLSNLKVAQFPWDPPPEPVRNTPTVPSNVPKPEPTPAPMNVTPQPQPAQSSYGSTHIKSEPGYDNTMPSYAGQANGFQSGLNGDLAQARASQLLQQRYGTQAHAAINAQGMSRGANIPGQQQRVGMQLPGQGQQPGQPQQIIPHRQANIYNSQTDGAGDASDEWNAIVAAKNAVGDDGPNGRLAADRTMRELVDEMAQRMDSGLMVPLDELNKGKKRKVAIRNRVLASSSANFGPLHVPKIPQLDGELGKDEDEDEERDDDAINSDLDDPEDELAEDDDDNDETTDYMLCTYDKVQRVKNKWKCTLKDGILTTNKKEYLFHKATGEFEW
ncbi:hypothetical protein K432DRAFT_396198 [Lepidopterella palustris CBS 459.81]|uniref:Transcription factor IIA, alpha/beta subunit n=1 Tax=Lepidopterella palustris CBS 459.81 TaxID=1314670 RepID=A0A8E2E3T4_9PEZI|nr:hypothetical protein K432DRAFT_396198 [Lepidopterella palustris CBS 459.81]